MAPGAEVTDGQHRFDAPRRPLGPARFADSMRRHGLRTDRRSRMLYWGRALAINGELVTLAKRADRALLQSLADRRVLAPDRSAAFSRAASGQLYEWYLAGWVHPDS